MPTYEYRCQKGHEFEVFQRMSEPPVEKCVQCGAPAERKLSAGAGVLFKGSGFYITDYRSEGYKQSAKKESEASKPAAAATESKPAAKAESKPVKSAKKD